MKVLRLLLYNGRDTHGFLQHDDADLQVHAEVHHDPVNALRDLLLLLHQNCLQLLVDEVDGDLLETVVLEDLKARPSLGLSLNSAHRREGREVWLRLGESKPLRRGHRTESKPPQINI